MKPLFECHLTYDQVTAEQEELLSEFAKQHDWKTSSIEGDPALGPGRRFFLTAHSPSQARLYARMRIAADTGPLKPIREKIEAIIHDTMYGIELKRPQILADSCGLLAGSEHQECVARNGVGDEPTDSDCKHRGSVTEAACAQSGCGFCSAAQQAKTTGRPIASFPSRRRSS